MTQVKPFPLYVNPANTTTVINVLISLQNIQVIKNKNQHESSSLHPG